MPLEGWDHLELWVGNAKQAAFWYEHALGFDRVAYAGPETGVRDRASYVLEQGEIRLVLTSGLRSDSEIVRFAGRHGDAAKDVALQVPDVARRVPRGRRAGRDERRRAALGGGRARPRRAGHDRDLRRERPHLRQPRRLRRPLPPRLRLALAERARRQRRRPDRDRPRRRQRRAREDERVGRVLRARLRDDEHRPLRRRPDPDRVLGADEQGDGGRRRQDQVPDQRAGRGQAQEPDRRVPRVQRRARASSTSPSRPRASCRRSRR